MEISERAAQLTPSLTLSIDSKAKAMKAEGLDVCGFGAGEPDFDTPEHIKRAAIEALEAGFTKYTPNAGIPELRQFRSFRDSAPCRGPDPRTCLPSFHRYVEVTESGAARSEFSTSAPRPRSSLAADKLRPDAQSEWRRTTRR